MTGENTQGSERDPTPLKKNLHHPFMKDELLTRALTRKAYAEMQKQKDIECEHQNMLCVLGDAVLDAIVAEMLTKKGVEKKGEITKKRQNYVSRVALHEVAKGFDLHEFIRTSIGERVDKNQSRIQAETFEAIVGAIFLDSDYETTRDAVLNWPKFKKLQKK
jgi:ribonuclease-3